MIHSEQEYETLKLEVLSKFTPEFVETNFHKDAVTYTMIRCLINGMNPYQVIEQLLKINISRQNQMEKLIELSPMPPITVCKEDFDKLIEEFKK